jgi:hypothetical protein
VLRRRSKAELPPLAEEEVYARSYGDRSDEVTNVKRREPEPEPERPKRMSDRALRDAFKTRLEKRDET